MRSRTIAFLAVLSVAAGCASVSPEVLHAGRAQSESAVGAASRTVFVVRRRWHIDVGFDIADLQARADRPGTPAQTLLAQTAVELPAVKYVFFGFGDRHYLMAHEHDAPALLGALWPGPGLILVTTLSNSPEEAFGPENVVDLTMSEAQMGGVQQFIANSLANDEDTRNADGSIRAYARGPYDGSYYFAAAARYSALHTCITWAADALRAGGVPVRAHFTVIARQLWGQLLKLGPAYRSIAGRRVAVLADDGGARPLRYDDGGFSRWRRTAAADAARQ